MRQFSKSSAITQCLENKVINMYGDSTVRQWFEHLLAFVPGDSCFCFFCFFFYLYVYLTSSKFHIFHLPQN